MQGGRTAGRKRRGERTKSAVLEHKSNKLATLRRWMWICVAYSSALLWRPFNISPRGTDSRLASRNAVHPFAISVQASRISTTLRIFSRSRCSFWQLEKVTW
jgi:hypothetical protein